MQIWRYGLARASQDDAATPAVENGWWNVTARAGDSAGGATVIGGETCTGNTPTPPAFCQTGTTRVRDGPAASPTTT